MANCQAEISEGSGCGGFENGTYRGTPYGVQSTSTCIVLDYVRIGISVTY